MAHRASLRTWLETRLEVSRTFVSKVAKTSDLRYYRHIVAANSRKPRVVWMPSRELKTLQRHVLVWLLETHPQSAQVNDCCFAFRPGLKSPLLEHAKAHAEADSILRLDIRQFFPSITADDVTNWLQDIGVSPADQKIAIQLLCGDPKHVFGHRHLVVGAPSSPHISNAIFAPMDEACVRYAAENKLTYSRYADDLYFSGRGFDQSKTTAWVADQLTGLARPAGLKLHPKKTKLMAVADGAVVTGLSLRRGLPPSVRRSWRRQLERELLELAGSSPSPSLESRVQGKLAFALSVDPALVRRLAQRRPFQALVGQLLAS